jgi:mono/diheme cytochrome c family protein
MNTARMIRTTLAAACAFASTLTLGACGKARRDEPITRPLVTDDPRITLGHRVFSQHCNQCHPGGAAGLAPSINDKPLPVGLMKTQVRKGLGPMPAFSEKEITDEELDGVIRYLKALRTL